MPHKDFKKEIRRYYRLHKRDLPWRHTHDPYKILVSEIMLQQTQVSRVIPYYKRFLKEFPNFKVLASTPINQLLSTWQGLGYNRRALNLKKLAQIVAKEHGGKLPDDFEALVSLPGVGKGTAGAITAFAFDKPVSFIETNIRRVFIHFFFSPKQYSDILQNIRISDAEILELIEKTLPKSNIREWYYALMDYGAMLGKKIPNPNRRSHSYHVQPRFRGSNRELRGKIIKLLLEQKGLPASEIPKRLAESPSRISVVIQALTEEGFIEKKGKRAVLSN